MALVDLTLTRNYAALQIYRQSQIDLPYDEIEAWTTDTNNNLAQIALDVFGAGYEYTNDGVAQFPTALVDRAAILDENETITGSWTFDDTVQFNQPVNSTSTFSSSGQPRVKAYRAFTNFTIPDGIVTDLALNEETYDVGNMHDLVSQNQRIIIPSGGSGSYILSAQVTFDPNGTGRREIRVEKNGSTIAQAKEFNPDASEQTVLQITFQDQAAVGDFYDLVIFQNTGGNLDVIFGEQVSYFTAMKVW